MISINPTSFGLGAIFGGGIGVFSTRRFLKEKLRAEVMVEAEQEVESMREHFARKELALLTRLQGKSPEEIVKEHGYVSENEGNDEENVRVLRAPVALRDEPLGSRSVRTLAGDEVATVEDEEPGRHVFYPHDQWDFKQEMAQRTGGKPYIIHHTEMRELPGFENVSYEYYPVDNVLVDEDGQQIEKIEEVVGHDTLDHFGHGSEDPNVVFVRNNRLHLHIEVQRLPGRSHAVDVLGLSDVEPD